MNRTDRLLAIVLELQAHGTRRAEDLAATFEVSRRTIYRDVQALCEAGVPVVAEPGRGYALVAGYFLPPLRFSADEAVMLLLGSDVMAQSFDADYRAAAQSAGRKIAGALPPDLRDEVRATQASIRFVGEELRAQPDEADRLQTIRGAILKRRTLRFRYHARRSASAPPDAPREVDPYGLTFVVGAWYMVGYDHLRRDTRTFRLARMDDLRLLDQTFTHPPGFALGPQGSGRVLTVRALFAPTVVRWVRETRLYFTAAEEERPDGLLVTLHVRHEDDVVQWLLGWGANVRVLEPDTLRARLASEAAAMLQQYQKS